MIPAPFAYRRVADIAAAVSALQTEPDAKVLAGGQSLIPLMKLRFATPSVLVDIGGIAELATLEATPTGLRIGALTTHATLARDPQVARIAPALSDAANALGDVQVRNRGTIGGSCAHNDPSADYPAVLLALGATLVVVGAAGTRTISADAFFGSMYETPLAPDELVTAIAFDAAEVGAYEKFPHPASGYAVVGAAVVLRLAGTTIARARVGLSGVAFGAVRAPAVEAALTGVRVDDAAALAAACVHATDDDVRSDAFASAEYRRAMADLFVHRALRRALDRAR